MTKKTSVPRKPRGTSDDAPGVAIGRRVAQLMDAHGMRVNELDRKIGQKGYTSRLIRGKKPHPTLPVLQNPAAAHSSRYARIMVSPYVRTTPRVYPAFRFLGRKKDRHVMALRNLCR